MLWELMSLNIILLIIIMVLTIRNYESIVHKRFVIALIIIQIILITANIILQIAL